MMIAALVMTLSANAQFEQGKMYVGASMTGFDASYSGATEFHLGIDAKAGYFFMDNLLALGQVGYKHNGYEGASDEFNIGVGGRYYIVQNGIFLGAGAKYVHSSGYNDFMPNVEVGYAFFLNDDKNLLLVALALTVVALLLYNYYTHNWFMNHKNR